MTRQDTVLRAWVVIVLAGVGAVGGCTPSPEPGSDREPDSDGVMARRLTPQEKAIEIGKKFANLRPKMTKAEVEAILGPPDYDYTPRIGDPQYFPSLGIAWTTYYASPPNLRPGIHVMSADYDITGPVPLLIKISGPHIPDTAPPPPPRPDKRK